MFNTLKKIGIIFVYILLGYFLECFCEIIHSDYLENIYRTPYFGVLITMTVFSFTLFSYISGKIVVLEEKVNKSLAVTRKEVKYAFVELVICDIISLILLVIHFSDLTDKSCVRIVSLSGLNAVFLLVVHILIDLGKSIFKMFEYERRLNEIIKNNQGRCIEKDKTDQKATT